VQQTSPISNIIGGLLGGTALLGGNGLGLLESGGSLTGMLKSDRHSKKDIKRIGILNDDQPVYKFRYKATEQYDAYRLLAQDVEKHTPERGRSRSVASSMWTTIAPPSGRRIMAGIGLGNYSMRDGGRYAQIQP